MHSLTKNLKLKNPKPQKSFNFEEMEKAIHEINSTKAEQKNFSYAKKQNNRNNDNQNSVENNKNKSLHLFTSKNHHNEGCSQKSDVRFNKAKFPFHEVVAAAKKNLNKIKSEDIQVKSNNFFSKKNNTLSEPESKSLFQNENLIIKLNECSNSQFEPDDDENEEIKAAAEKPYLLNLINIKYSELPNIHNKSSFDATISSKSNESCISRQSNNNFENTFSNNVDSISNNSSGKFNNKVPISAADSFKSINAAAYSFKIKLNKMEENNDTDYFEEETTNIDKKNKLNNFNEEQEYDDKNCNFTEISEELKHNFVCDSEKLDENNQRKDRMKKVRLSENICGYMNKNDSGDADFVINKKYSLRLSSKRRIRNVCSSSNTKLYNMTEINFLDSVENRKANNSIIKKNLKIRTPNKNKKSLHSTDTSSFIIQLKKKIQNEEQSNLKEKENQSNIINLFTNNESEDYEHQDEINNRKNGFLTAESRENDNHSSKRFKKIPIQFNFDNYAFENEKDANEINEDKMPLLEDLKLLRCKTSHKKTLENSNFNNEINNSFRKFPSAILNKKMKLMRINNCEKEISLDKKTNGSGLNKNRQISSKNNIESGTEIKYPYNKSGLDTKAKIKGMNSDHNCKSKHKRQKNFISNQDNNRINENVNCAQNHNTEQNTPYNSQQNFDKIERFEKYTLNNNLNNNCPKEARSNVNSDKLCELSALKSTSLQKRNFYSKESDSKNYENNNYNNSSVENPNQTDFKIKLHECSPSRKLNTQFKKNKTDGIYSKNY